MVLNKDVRKRLGAVLLVFVMVAAAFVPAAAFAEEGVPDYDDWSNPGVYPQDVMGTRYLAAVSRLMNIKAVTGDADGLFHPEKPISRAEFCAIMARSIAKAMPIEEAAKQDYFTDLDGYSWAKGYINYCYEQGIVKGVGDGKFAPDKNISNAELITVLIRYGNRGGTDPEGIWPDNFILEAQYQKLLGGDVMIEGEQWSEPATKGNVAILVVRKVNPL